MVLNLSLMLFLLTFMFLLISGMLSILGWLLGIKSKQQKEKLNPFECGFDNFSSYRFPLSLRFFLMTVLFLLFDIEMVLFLPLPLSLAVINLHYLYLLVSLFMMLLVGGLYFEWQQGSLEWN